jgi:hypothetical protein
MQLTKSQGQPSNNVILILTVVPVIAITTAAPLVIDSPKTLVERYIPGRSKSSCKPSDTPCTSTPVACLTQKVLLFKINLAIRQECVYGTR